MTEAEFSTSTEPDEMLQFLWDNGRVTRRKLGLFAVGVVRRLWPQVHRGVHRVVEASEQFLDGLASQDELERAVRATGALRSVGGGPAMPTWLQLQRSWGPARREVSATAALLVSEAAVGGSASTRLPSGESWLGSLCRSLYRSAKWGRRAAERKGQAALLRDVFGDRPFRPCRADRSWRTPAVLAVAKALYEERRWGEVPVLGDALEEAGCTDAEMLEHCRGPGPHARGCWLTDLLLKKE